MPSTNGHGPKGQAERVALYMRVSSEKQREAGTIQTQRAELERHAAARATCGRAPAGRREARRLRERSGVQARPLGAYAARDPGRCRPTGAGGRRTSLRYRALRDGHGSRTAHVSDARIVRGV